MANTEILFLVRKPASKSSLRSIDVASPNKARNEMIEKYLPLVRKIAASLYAQTTPNVEFDDLVSTGVFGLIDAIRNFDPNRNVEFAKYCRLRIRGAMIDELRYLDWVPRLARQRRNILNRTQIVLQSRLNRVPTKTELAAELKMETNEFERLYKDASNTNIVSLAAIACAQDTEQNAADIIKNEKSPNPEDELEKKDAKEFVLKGLTNIERHIIHLYYYEELSMHQVGKILDLTEGRISQIHSKIIEHLRTRIDTDKENFMIAV